MDNAQIVLRQSAIMLLLIAFGVFLYKQKIFTKDGCKQLSNFVMRAVCPVLIFTSYQRELDANLVHGLLMAFLLSFISYVIMIGLGTVFFRRSNRGENYCIECFAIGYSNCGFLGIPLVEAVYGSDGVLYLTAAIALFNLLSWSHGVMLLTGKFNAKSLLQVLKTPVIISTIVGLALFFLQIRLPEIVLEPLNYISSLNTPMAMLVSGLTIAQSDILKALRKPGIYLTNLFKLIIGPLIVIAVLTLFRADETVTNSIIIATSAPSAATVVMFSSMFDKDSIYAAEIFTVSTLFGVITMPIMLILAQFARTLL